MQKNLVKQDPRLIRALGSGHLRQNSGKYLLGILTYYIFVELIPLMLGVVFPRSYFDVTGISKMLASSDVDMKQMPYLPFVIVIYGVVFAGIFSFGRSIYLLTELRNNKVQIARIFDGFQFFFKAFLLNLTVGIVITLWTLCFIVPGIIAVYTYRQSFFILVDDPSKGVLECMRESKSMMDGNKANLFRLDLTYLLSILAALLLTALGTTIFNVNQETYAGVIVYFLLRLPFYAAMGNFYIGMSVFYELLIYGDFSRFKFKGESIFRNYQITE